MAGKKRGLGRGLDALLGGSVKTTLNSASDIDSDKQPVNKKTDGELHNVPVEFIQPGVFQPRIDMHPEALEELASSIKAQGVIQPIVIRPIGDATASGDQK